MVKDIRGISQPIKAYVSADGFIGKIARRIVVNPEGQEIVERKVEHVSISHETAPALVVTIHPDQISEVIHLLETLQAATRGDD